MSGISYCVETDSLHSNTLTIVAFELIAVAYSDGIKSKVTWEHRAALVSVSIALS